MKYLKYKGHNKLKRLADKEYLNSLDIKGRKIVKRKRLVNKLYMLATAFFWLCLFCVFIYLLHLIPEPNNSILKILFDILFVFLIIIAFILSVIITVLIFGKAMAQFGQAISVPIIKKEYIISACKDIRETYGITNDYLITKCFDCSEDKFINHDVCIFKVGSELRISADIIHGFLNSKSDLGCYSFSKEEITILKKDYNDKRVTEVQVETMIFVLGIKAYSYILKKFEEN